MGTEVSRLAQGEFNPHRQGLTEADDVTKPVTNSKEGVNGRDSEVLLGDLAVTAGSVTSALLEVLTYSEAQGQYVSQSPPAQFQLNGPGQFVFPWLYGRHAFVRVNQLTGSNAKIDINLSIFRRNAIEFS